MDSPHVAAQVTPHIDASFGARLGAHLLDGLILVVANNVIGFAVGFALGGLGLLESDSGFWNLFVLLMFVLDIVFLGWMHAEQGGTPGMKIVSIETVDDSTGGRVSLGRGIGREAFAIISAIPFALGFLWAAWDAKSQTWHDKVANTRVVKPQEGMT